MWLFIAEQTLEQQTSELQSSLEKSRAELVNAQTDLAEQEDKYELLKEKAQKKLHDFKKQLNEKDALLLSGEQVSLHE